MVLLALRGGWVGCGRGSVNVMFSCVTVDAPLMIPCRGVTCSEGGVGWVGGGVLTSCSVASQLMLR